ncbi:hypothetical protein SEVIR_3G426200v4 [Setaria viridis]|uniref:Uncharacterized protein n=2 Tax=Setaria TaxID=4554 RepID=K3ZAJ7_SETIT|nr:uncharacterized protein LOC101760945 [Setaria italica]XP_034588368.1 uncharacterized protein LOC117850616 [Setaria viridis]RCV19723.1 hypothetical protein SETIT_3G408200v2 [Setaria italica]TKW29909.1 hypothetical protein SEVIR_3G426200v2 [Setaria viridis]
MAAWVARQQAAVPPATSMMARVDRLDLVLGYLEEMTMQQHGHRTSTAASGAWSPSTASSSSAASTPRGSKTWRRRPAKEALEEAQAKGTLVDRIGVLEDRVLKMEEDMDINITTMSAGSSSSRKKSKGIKSLVKSCVRGKLKTKE